MRYGVGALVLLSASWAFGDTVQLKTGERIEGVVVEINDDIVRIQKGPESSSVCRVFKRSDVESVQFGTPELSTVRDVALRQVRQGRFAEAVKLWKYLSALQPDVVEHQVVLAYVARQAGRLDEAAVAARSAVRLAPQDPRAHLELGEVSLASGDTKVAAARALDAVRFSPKSPVAGYALLGRAFEKAGLLEESVDAFRTALKHEPLHEEAFVHLAAVLCAKGIPAEAEVLARERSKNLPREREGWLVLGKALLYQNRLEEAAQTFKHAITLGGPGFDRARVFHIVADARRTDRDPASLLGEQDRIIARELDLRRNSP